MLTLSPIRPMAYQVMTFTAKRLALVALPPPAITLAGLAFANVRRRAARVLGGICAAAGNEPRGEDAKTFCLASGLAREAELICRHMHGSSRNSPAHVKLTALFDHGGGEMEGEGEGWLWFREWLRDVRPRMGEFDWPRKPVQWWRRYCCIIAVVSSLSRLKYFCCCCGCIASSSLSFSASLACLHI